MSKYKLLALDMDGTLLNSEKKISPVTSQAIYDLLKKGVAVVLSTGRGLAELKDYSEELKPINYGILISGGMVYDFTKKKPVTRHPLDTEKALKLLEGANAERGMVHILTVEKSVVREEDIQNMKDFRMEIYQGMFDRVTTRCNDFEKFIRENEILKFNIYHRSPESRLRNVKRFENLNLTSEFAEETSLESSPKGITKASGLVELCEYLKINLEETIAVGDAYNDIEILKTAGLAVAMGNSIDEVKKIADFVTDDNDNDGVAKVIEKYF